MAAVYNKELLGWYLITLKIRETVESRLPKKSTYGGNIVPDYEPRPPESEWVVSIDEKLDQGRQENLPGSWANLSIYRFPHYLKDGDDKDWVPQIVSLGPYHHGKDHLRHMERHKWRCLHRILERSHQAIGRYLESVKKVEGRARAFYEGTITMSSDEFVEMMVLDGCFVIEMLRGFAEGFEELGYPRNDPVFSIRRSMLEIQRDMIMLENQIPLFILDRLLGLQLGGPNQKGRMAKLAIQFLDPLLPVGHFDPCSCTRSYYELSSRRLYFDPLCNHGRVHCLEVFRRSLLQLGPKRSKTNELSQSRQQLTLLLNELQEAGIEIRSARHRSWSKTKEWLQSRQQLTFCLTELREEGIEIRSAFHCSWWDVQFKDGILRIPPLEIHEGTRSLFLNLIAFEQSQFDCSNCVTSYVIFMHNLINSPEDVRYLRNHGIIKHCLGSDAKVADLFNRLCQEVAFDIEDSYLQDLSWDVTDYYDRGFLPLAGEPRGTGSEIAMFCKFGFRFLAHQLARKVEFLESHSQEQGVAFDIIDCYLFHLYLDLDMYCLLKEMSFKAALAKKWNSWRAILKNKYFDNPWSIISFIAAFVLLVLTFIQALYAVYGYYGPRS
ncbi:UPF0481 protein At3g47200-like [Syzygium oleosum]|uniref:UPF0481 protein At3g47200-like n=1 Tax=Syzygium oleosum TaxID=219896 RepID=UPI0024B90EEC|nr:UPF0481 protein At3g47200-like [Syzygium oleosum]